MPWGVYPIGYMLPMWFADLSLNWIHISFSLAEMVNKIGASLVVYLVARRITEERVPEERMQEARTIA